jgi:hypothetical protein
MKIVCEEKSLLCCNNGKRCAMSIAMAIFCITFIALEHTTVV